MYQQKGLSLIELMIAITLSLILMAGVIQMFLSSRTTFTTQQGMSRVQETGRLAINFIVQDVRMAGFTGFRGRGSTITSTISPVTLFNNYAEGISVLSPPQTGINAINDTDILVIRGALSGASATVSDDVSAGLIRVPATNINPGACEGGSDQVSGLCAENVLVIADYMKARVFTPTGLAVNGGNLEISHAGTWGGDIINPDEFFTYGAQVSPMSTVVYFIGNGTSGRPSLFQSLDGETLELLEGVSDLKVTYSRFSSPNTFADAVDEMGAFWNDRVNPLVSMKIELLVQSVEDNILDARQGYSFAGEDEVAEDRRMYQTFATTIALRNQLP